MSKNSEIKKVRLFLGSYVNSDIIYSSLDSEKLEQDLNCSMKFVEKENIHLTWKFIGDIEQDKVDKIISTIQEIISSPLNIEVKFQEFAIWPNGRLPRQLVVTGIDLNSEGIKLYKELNKDLVKFGIDKEKRSFNPHITVARFRVKEKLKESIILPEWFIFKESIIKFSRIDLIQSTLTPKGSIYKSIQSFEI